ncbi:hypothetical protein [Aphanizomenon flos-aquae]|uniref:hypothetical protein n=1 Tax=Aphanizomenon flos-aquae TaxID=1176 RepID=UPI00190F604F|nr:hypothetical protein [Aphanizomenon flos-aquae]
MITIIYLNFVVRASCPLELYKLNAQQLIYKFPISIDELYEFLLVEEKEKQSEIYELRKVYA